MTEGRKLPPTRKRFSEELRTCYSKPRASTCRVTTNAEINSTASHAGRRQPQTSVDDSISSPCSSSGQFSSYSGGSGMDLKQAVADYMYVG